MRARQSCATTFSTCGSCSISMRLTKASCRRREGIWSPNITCGRSRRILLRTNRNGTGCLVMMFFQTKAGPELLTCEVYPATLRPKALLIVNGRRTVGILDFPFLICHYCNYLRSSECDD